MSRINIDKTSLNTMYTEDLIAVLQDMIADELSKDDDKVNTDFIDECVNALLEIEQDEDNTFKAFVPLFSSEEYLGIIEGKKHIFKRLNKYSKIAIIAAVAAASSITVNAAVDGITGVNLFKEAGVKIQETFERLGDNKEKSKEEAPAEVEAAEKAPKPEEETTKAESEEETPQAIEAYQGEAVTAAPAVEETAESKAYQKPAAVQVTEENNNSNSKPEQNSSDSKKNKPSGKTSNETVKPAIPDKPSEKKEAVFESLEASFNNFKTDYIYGESLSYEGLTLNAVYSDGSKRGVPLSECDYTRSLNMNVTADYTLRVIYKTSKLEIPITVRPDEETRGSEVCKNDEFEYFLTSKGVYITKYLGESKNLDLETVDGHEVYAIGSYVFENSELQTVYAPNVKKIFDGAFKNSKALWVINSENAEYIGESAFEGCEKLSSPSFSSNAEHIGKAAYKETGIKSIVLPNGMEAVPDSLCEACEKLETLNLKNAKEIGNSAFEGCAKLETITNMGGVKKIGSFAFYGDELATLDSAPAQLESVGDSGLAYCKKLEIKTLPSTVKEIGEYAFLYCTKMETANIANGIKTIPTGAFWGTHLKTLTLPDGLESIEQAAFMSTVIKNVTIPSSVKRIESRALHAATRLNVTFEGSPEYIDESAFFNFSYLKFYAHQNTYPVDYAEEHGIDYELI